MNLLTIYLTDYCNLNCDYCLARKYNRRGNNLQPHFTAAQLLQWMDAYTPPNKWLIERTGGGEPTMHPEYDYLTAEFEKRGYFGVDRINGSIAIKRSPNFKTVTTWHKGNYTPVKSDCIFILKSPADDWRKKEEYCKQNGIPYKLKELKNYCLPKCFNFNEMHFNSNTFIRQWQIIYPNGVLANCNKGKIYGTCGCGLLTVVNTECKNCGTIVKEADKIQSMCPSLPKSPCAFCQPIANMEGFFNEAERKYLRERRDKAG